MKRRLCTAAMAALLMLLLLPVPPTAEVFAPRGSRVELPVIMYHSLVTDEQKADAYVCPVSRVERDLQWLRDKGYQPVSAAQLAAFADGTGTLPQKPVLLTLDDGYRNNLTLLPPLLERYDACAVIAVVGEYADIYTASGEDGSLHSCMSWQDVARAAQQPRLELACHSYYFHHLEGRNGSSRKAGEDYAHWQEAFRSDTAAILQALRQQGAEPLCYAYPFGQITEGADEILKDLGFRVSLSCSEMRSIVISGDPNSLFSLGRYNRDGRWSTEEFMKKLFG